MPDELMSRCQKYSEHFSYLLQMQSMVIDIINDEIIFETRSNPRFCKSCTYTRCNEMHTHLYGCNQAYKWKGKYIYYCPLGLIYVAISVSNGNELLGGITAGPMIMGDLQQTLQHLPDKEMIGQVLSLPVLSTARVNHLSEILAAITIVAANMPPQTATEHGTTDDNKLLETINWMKKKYPLHQSGHSYPIDLEKKLHTYICNHDRESSEALLDTLLQHIFFSGETDLDVIRARIVELMVILSRATIDAGADIEEIFCFSSSQIKEIEKFQSIEQLHVWIGGILQRFIGYTFDFALVKHADVVYKVMEYIRERYAQKITLDEIAKHVYLSRSYLSSMFKEATGESITGFINKVRVEKSKTLLTDELLSLSDIAVSCGFEDQSYFTKVFRRYTQTSPKRYRENKGALDSHT